MYQDLLQILFAQDHRFLTLRTTGIPGPVQAAMAGFWSGATYATLPFHAQMTPSTWDDLVKMLEMAATGGIKGGDFAFWRGVADQSKRLATVEPVAGALVALQAMGAWMGALGENVFAQPWQGHHPGWHLFPLIAASNLVAADAIWSARFLSDTARGFIESAKNAPFDPTLRGIVEEYRAVSAAAEDIYRRCVDELAWALHTNATSQGETFRLELAALFWTDGDVPHGEMLRPDGPADYTPPYALVRALVDRGMLVLERDPLVQSIWLNMKDRGPFSLRDHQVLFGRINNRFRGHALHGLDEFLPVSISDAYARAVIARMRGAVPEATTNDLLDAMAMTADLLKSQAPATYLRIAMLATMIQPADPQASDTHWHRLAGMAADILEWADHSGIHEPFDHTLDGPFHALRADSGAATEQALDRIEAYRQANLGYWLAVSPPLLHEAVPETLLEQEEILLQELRGARFIRMLPYLPSHYRRYGFEIGEALAGPPAGVTRLPEDKGLLRFDPFDQQQAQANLHETRDRLLKLYEAMRARSPGYAECRIAPPKSVAAFTAALNAHRTGKRTAPV